MQVYKKFLNKKQNFNVGGIVSVFSGERFIGMFKVINNKGIFAYIKELKKKGVVID